MRKKIVSRTAVAKKTPKEFDSTQIIERPDGFYWLEKTNTKEYGPFATLLAAKEDMFYNEETDFEPGETLLEAEQEIGIADWIDPDTGELAEESKPHIEDH